MSINIVEISINKSTKSSDLFLIFVRSFININTTKEIRKNPHKTKNIQRGVGWQLPASKIKGPNFLIFERNCEGQFIPIPLIKALKFDVKGREKIYVESNIVPVPIKNL